MFGLLCLPVITEPSSCEAAHDLPVTTASNAIGTDVEVTDDWLQAARDSLQAQLLSSQEAAKVAQQEAEVMPCRQPFLLLMYATWLHCTAPFTALHCTVHCTFCTLRVLGVLCATTLRSCSEGDA
jgi:hypothetical protein